ncbi:MAG: Ni/Fe hydrogenase subunit alpha [Gammaproteobacteria bacterium]|nr:Ni/Fe hydrogenase subunit alpha [Gammaproteobacteria bacterium]
MSENGGSKTIRVDYLARVEGEGALHIRYDNEHVHDVQLKIFEPPRFFEAFLRGRDYLEAPDITARICGICPVAYQMSAVHAMEDALALQVEPGVRHLRRLLYCGEWIESHVLHVAMLHAPDFLKVDSAMDMAKTHPQVVQQALALKKAGNAIVRVLGGREIHPINVRVGGFYRLPDRRELLELRAELAEALTLAETLTRWVTTLSVPAFMRDPAYLFVALTHDTEYPMNLGTLRTSTGDAIAASNYEQRFIEHHVEYSNALHCLLDGKTPYFVGPMARFALNFANLHPAARTLASELGVAPPCANPFASIIVRALEVVHAVATALDLLDGYQPPSAPFVTAELKSGRGHAITEAPRGILYHRYDIAEDGRITEAKIVPPTSQNQKTIEDDLRLMLPDLMDLPEDDLRHRCEQAIRNYDPCISCATHFLTLTLDKV